MGTPAEVRVFRLSSDRRDGIVAPLRYAVAFVYRNHTDFHLLQFGAEDFSIEPFGGDIEELEIAEYTVLQCDDDFLPAHA